MSTNAFITGSRAYGTPTEKSDLDLVILVSGNDSDILWGETEVPSSVRFGRLNLLIFQKRDRFERWRQVTEALIQRRPVTREDAVSAFKSAGFTDPYFQTEA